MTQNRDAHIADLRNALARNAIVLRYTHPGSNESQTIDGSRTRLDEDVVVRSSGLGSNYLHSVYTVADDWDPAPSIEAVVEEVDGQQIERLRVLGLVLDAEKVSLRIDLGHEFGSGERRFTKTSV